MAMIRASKQAWRIPGIREKPSLAPARQHSAPDIRATSETCTCRKKPPKPTFWLNQPRPARCHPTCAKRLAMPATPMPQVMAWVSPSPPTTESCCNPESRRRMYTYWGRVGFKITALESRASGGIAKGARLGDREIVGLGKDRLRTIKGPAAVHIESRNAGMNHVSRSRSRALSLFLSSSPSLFFLLLPARMAQQVKGAAPWGGCLSISLSLYLSISRSLVDLSISLSLPLSFFLSFFLGGILSLWGNTPLTPSPKKVPTGRSRQTVKQPLFAVAAITPAWDEMKCVPLSRAYGRSFLTLKAG